MNDDEKTIRGVAATWIAATKRGDLETVLDLMEEDVVFLVPGAEPFGKTAFAEASREMTAGGMTIDGESEVLEVKILGDWAFMTTRLRIKASRPGAPEMVRAGHSLTILHKRDGRWRLARDANLLAPAKTSHD
ncbi:YybH family protein [Paludisphaera rhizosphaerae]|uniref:YybH family protein n=1 Tax=Paludisphaera rhizosphaerae TaxID=2711216 RepID=UPI0013EB334C|nr:SgcJ/EcaC family oxidoreductase [Paludisphaera rhizosphaerae]